MLIDQILITLLIAIIIASFVSICIVNLYAGFVLYVILLPLTQANFIVRFGLFDISPSYIFGSVLIVVWFCQRYLKKKRNEEIITGQLRMAMAAFILAFIISIVFSPLPILGIKELVKHVFFLAIVILGVDLINTERKSFYLMKWWFISICIFVGWCLLLFILRIPPLPCYLFDHKEGLLFSVTKIEYLESYRIASGIAYRNLYVGLGNNPDKLAGLSFIGIFLGLGLMQYTRRMKLVYVFLIVILIIGLFLTYTRSAWLVTPLGILWLLYKTSQKGSKKSHLILLLLVLISLVSAIFLIAPLHSRIFVTFEITDGSEYNRQAMWNYLWAIIEQNPVKGVGPGVVSKTLAQFAFVQKISDVLEDKYSAHNVVLTIWAELGTLGLLSFVCLIYIGLFAKGKSLENTNKDARYMVLVESIRAALLAWSLFMCFHPESTPWFWTMLGLAIGMGTRVRPSKTAEPSVALSQAFYQIRRRL